MFGIKFTLAKVLGGALLTLAIIAMGLAWQYRGEIIKSSGLESKIDQLRQTDSENREAIARITKELQVYEATIAMQQADYEQARVDHDERVTTMKSQLNELRHDFKTIDDFLSAPVPAEYVRYRMLQERPGDYNANGSGAD